jgi:hypothetical protein
MNPVPVSTMVPASSGGPADMQIDTENNLEGGKHNDAMEDIGDKKNQNNHDVN